MKKDYDSPSEEVSMRNNSRRRFLVGAGASALALPFLSKAAQAQTCVMNTCPVTTECLDTNPQVTPVTPSCKVDPSTGSCCSLKLTPPGSPATINPATNQPWCQNVSYADDGKFFIRGCMSEVVCGYNSAVGSTKTGIKVSGVRHYCENYVVPSVWPTRPNLTPGQTGPFFCMTIYPNINDLIGKPMGQNLWDSALHDLFSGASSNPFNGPYGRDMLSVWHEVAYSGSTGGKQDGNHQQINAFYEKKMQDYLLEFKQCHGYTAPAIGAIECDNGEADYGVSRISNFVTEGLDFVADDLYYTNQYDPVACLTAWDNQWGHGAGKSATISVAECNVSEHYDWRTLRPLYFTSAAYWLYNQGNKGARCFLTFWRFDDYVGLSGGPWISGATGTIDALQAIGDGSALTGPVPSAPPQEGPLNSAVCWTDGLS